MHQSLLEGENRFGWLYEDAKYEKFSACFGSLIGGHSRRHFKDLLDAKTVKNKNSKLVAEASKRWSSWLRSLCEVLFIRDGREKLSCKACMVSRFWFLVSVVHSTNCRERSNSKTKTCSCFWIQLWSRLDGRSAKTKNENAFLVFRFCRTNWTDLRAANFTELY